MEECLRGLIANPEWEGDMILATQVRCALISQELTDQSISFQQLTFEDMRIPVYLHRALSSQLQEIKRTLPPSIAQHGAWTLPLCIPWPVPYAPFQRTTRD